MASTFDSGSSGLGSCPGRADYAVFLDKTLYCYSASLYPGEEMDTDGFNTVG